MRKIFALFSALLFAFMFVNCDDQKTYAERLKDEEKAINKYLEGKDVQNVPADSVFLPNVYYKIKASTSFFVYMKVLDNGDMDVRPVKNDLIYFRYKRTNLLNNESGGGNWNTPNVEAYMVYGTPSTQGYGIGVELPMNYLGEGAQIELVVPSQVGFTSEMNSVIPYLYTIKYETIIPRN